jgi:hypothetical protein
LESAEGIQTLLCALPILLELTQVGTA